MADIAELALRINSLELKEAQRDLTKFGAEGDKTSSKISAFGGVASKSLGAVALAAGAALGALAGIGTAISTIREFETSMSKLGAVTGATAGEMVAMRDIARDLGATTEFSATQAADGLTFLGMAGFTAAESMAAIPAVLDLATASAMGLGASADITSNIMSGFGIAAADAANVTDILAAASSRANTDVAQLGAAMSTVAPIAAALDMNLADTAAAIGVMSDAGIQGERAGTALRGVLASLAGPTTEARDVLASLGLTIADVDPAANSLSDVMAKLGASGLSTADAMAVFGREAASGALVLVEGAGRLREFGDELGNVDGAAADMADTMRDNLGGDVDGLQSAISGLMLSLGDAGLTAVLRVTVQALTGLVTMIAQLADGAGVIVRVIGDAGRLVFGFGESARNTSAAIDAVTKSVADEVAALGNLSAALLPGITMSRDAATAKLNEAEAIYSKIEAARQEQVQAVRSSEEYRKLASAVDDAAFKYETLRELGKDAFAPNANRADMEYWLDQLSQGVAEQERLVKAGAPLTSQIVEAKEAMEILRNAIAESDGDMVTLAGNAGVTSSNISSAAGEAARLAQNLSAAASALSAVMNATANMNVSAIGLEAQNKALAAGNTLIQARTEGLLAAKRVELADAFGSEDAIIRAAATAELENYTEAVNRNSAAQEVNQGILDARSEAEREAGKAATAGSKASKAASSEAAKAAKEAQKSYEDQLNAAQKLTEKYFTPIEKYADAVAELDDIMGQGHISAETYARAMADINDELADSYPLVNDVADAFGDFVAGGLSDFNGFVDSILGSFKSMLSEMIATAARNKIMLSMGIGGGGVGAAASALGGGMGAMGGGIMGSIGSLGSVFMNGATGVGSALMSGGLSAGVGQLGATLAGATSSVAGFAAAAGAVALPLAAAYGAFKFFTGSTKTLDAGIRLNIEGNELLAESYKKVQKSRFFGMSKSTNTKYSDLENSGLSDAYASIYAGAEEAAWALGLSSKALNGYTEEIKISTKGMDEAQAQAAALEALQQAQNGLANEFFKALGKNSRNLIRDGEEAGAAMARVGSAVQSSTEYLALLGHQVKLLGLAGANSAVALIDGLGGQDSAANAITSYVDAFYTAGEKARMTIGALQTGLSGIGMGGALPATAEQFRAIIDRQIAAGQMSNAAALINLAPLFDQWITLRKEKAAAELAVIKSNLQAEASLQGQIWQLTGNVTAIRNTELSSLTGMRRILQERIYALQDVAAAEQASTAVLNERMGIQRQIWTLMGNENALRADTISGLDASNQALQRQLYALTDQKAAQEALAKASDDAAAAIQKLIDAVDPAKFSNSFAYNQALASAARGQSPSRTTSTGVTIAAVPQATSANGSANMASELAALRAEIAGFREESRALKVKANADIRKLRQNSDRAEAIGAPVPRGNVKVQVV